MTTRLGYRLAALALLAAGPALAENRAVVVANSDYARLPDVAQVAPADAIAGFKKSGFRTVEGHNLDAANLRRALGDLLRPDDAPGLRVVVLQGRFVHSGDETWFLAADAGAEDRLSIDLVGVPLSAVAGLLQGQRSVLLLGTDQARFDTGNGLQPGLGTLPPAPGVTVIAGYTDGIGRAAEVLSRRDGTVALAMRQGQSLRLLRDGATPPGTQPVVVAPSAPAGGSRPVVVRPPPADGTRPVVVPSPPVGGGQPVVVPPRRLDEIAAPSPEEQAAWTRAKRSNSAEGYREFLQKYPGSLYAGAARGRMGELTPVPRTVQSGGPEQTEAALNLSRAQKAQIQRQLTLLAYDTNGIDGSFGPATRRAIAAFQRNSGVAATGYLTAPQIDLLGRSAAIRSRGLEAEARQRQAAAEAADNRYWTDQRQAGAAGAERYLSRYPQGQHADAARKVLTDAARQGGDATGDDTFWARARASGVAADYHEYLDKYPRGRHAADAQAALARLSQRAAEDQAAEAALDLSPAVRQVVEQRLNDMGIDAGRADGRFDAQTRQAIRRYQSARNLRISGYLNQSTVARMLADTLLDQN